MAISDKTKQLFADHGANQHIFALATASKTGIPNVVPIGFLWVANDDEVWVIDNYLNKTLANIRENPVAAVYAMGGESGKETVQLKGKCVYETEGADYEAAVAMAHKINPGFPAKGLVKIRISCAFDTTPGPNAGKKL
ncbi:MAG: pyridoxamine 5'-phosphate oxidase family protein [archaeon]|nr:pyridoxamine 5'-phosphate oxidase family protein [archaeon]